MPFPRPVRILLRTILLGVTVVIPVGLLLTCSLSPSQFLSKISPSDHSHAAGGSGPTPTPGPYVVEVQTEPHTCGYHSLSTIYRAYGLSPEDLDLRFRLGTDNIAIPLDDTSTGTIHPDIVRVAKQDGFRASMLGTSPDSVQRVRAHLAAGHPIMALTRTERVGDEGGGLHWVVVTEAATTDASTVRVIDSLTPEPYTRSAPEYLTQTALSVILIRPQ